MKIKANGELFNEIYKYASRVTRLATIVQNDMEITPEEYQEWAKSGLLASNCIKEWMQKVAAHIRSNNE